jgi:caspase domain-containing protein
LIRTLFALALAAFLAGAPAHAQAPAPRVALIIGNAAYQSANGIATAAADATIVAETMRTAGYDVTELHDVVAADFGQAIRTFLDKVYAAGPEAVAFIYFGGYGAQFDGENYLVPVDARIARYADVPAQAFRLNDLVRELAELPAAARVIVLDASRDHGFGRDTKEAVPPGLAMMDAPAGMMIAFAAAPGAVSGEIEGPYSLYTGTLVTLMRQPGLDIEQIFKATRLQVNKVSTGAQTPWSSSTLAVGLKLFDAPDGTPAPQAAAPAPPAAPPVAAAPPPPAPAAAPAPVAEVQPPPLAAIPPVGRSLASRDELRQLPPEEAYARVVETDTLRDYQWFVDVYPSYRLTPQVWVIIETRREAILWRRAVNRNTPRAYWNYLKRYPDGPHAEEARMLLVALTSPPVPPPDYLVEPEPMPAGWWDEAVDLVEVVPQGYDPPPPVFDDLPPAFVVAPPPLFPPPIGFYAPPHFYLVPPPPPVGVLVVAPARIGPVVVIRPPPVVRVFPPLVARPVVLMGGRRAAPPPPLRPLPAFARAPVGGLVLPAAPPGRARVLSVSNPPGTTVVPRTGVGLPPSARPTVPFQATRPFAPAAGTGAVKAAPLLAKQPPPKMGIDNASKSSAVKEHKGKGSPPIGAKMTNTAPASGSPKLRTPPPAALAKPPSQAMKVSPPPRPPPPAAPPRPATAAPRPAPPPVVRQAPRPAAAAPARRPVCRTVNGKQVCS